jgi:hypothetical protein
VAKFLFQIGPIDLIKVKPNREFVADKIPESIMSIAKKHGPNNVTKSINDLEK